MYLKLEVHAFQYSNKYYFLYTKYIQKNLKSIKTLDFKHAKGKKSIGEKQRLSASGQSFPM